MKEIVKYVEEKYGVKYSVSGMTALLYRSGFVYKKPKVVPGKADPEKQAKFIKVYQEIKEGLKEEDQVYFVDSIHPQHNTRASYGWILKGEEKLIPSNSGRQRVNLNGALNLKNHSVIINEEERINAKAILKLLRQLKQRHPKGEIYIFLDNARYHHAKKVKEWLKRHKRFKVIFLPPYSPNLNLIERLWKFFYEKVVANKYYESFGQFKEAIYEFFKGLAKYKEELTRLLADSFQLIPSVKLQT